MRSAAEFGGRVAGFLGVVRGGSSTQIRVIMLKMTDG